MSYANYCTGITGQTGNIDLNLPNQSIPYLVSTPYGSSGATGFLNNGATGGINSTYTSAGYNYMIYSCHNNIYNGTVMCAWAIICTNGATAPYQTPELPTVTYITPTVFPVCGFNTTPILNISLPSSSSFNNNVIYQPEWNIYGIPQGIYWLDITIGVVGQGQGSSNYNAGVPLIVELVCFLSSNITTIISGGQSTITGVFSTFNATNLTYSIQVKLYPALTSGDPTIFNPVATIKLIKRW